MFFVQVFKGSSTVHSYLEFCLYYLCEHVFSDQKKGEPGTCMLNMAQPPPVLLSLSIFLAINKGEEL